MRKLLLLVVLVALATSLACSESESVECSTPSQEVMQHIANALTVNGQGSVRAGQAVLVDPELPEGGWYVAADIQGPGLDGNEDIAVWVVPNLSSPSLLFSAEAMAQEFSGMGYFGGDNNMRVAENAKRIRAAESCTKSILSR